jgi:hypothetical protein
MTGTTRKRRAANELLSMANANDVSRATGREGTRTRLGRWYATGIYGERGMKISSKDQSKLKILNACAEWKTAKEISKEVHLGLTTVHCYLWELESYVLKDKRSRFALYKRNPERLFTPEPVKTRQEIMKRAFDSSDELSAVMLQSGPLASLREYIPYTRVRGEPVVESNPKVPLRKSSPHIGCGSSAYVDMNG